MLDTLLANWPLKLLAIALAFAIWVSVTGENRVVQDFKVPLEIQLPDDLALASDPPTAVDVRFRGLESVMRRLDPVPMAVRVDLRDATSGEREVLLSRQNLIGVPRGVEVDFMDPDRAELVVETRRRRDLRVEPTFLGQPAQGFAFYGARVSPKRLRVDGPSSQVDALEVLRTNPIRLDDRSEPFMTHVGVVPEGKHVRLVDQDTLDVLVLVDAAAVERRLEDVPVEVVGAPPGTTVEPAALHVTVSGPPQLVEKITPDQVRLIADASGLSPDAAKQNIEVRAEFAGFDPDERARLSVESISQGKVRVTPSGRRSL